MASLGDLRQYAADMLADASDGKSDRVIQRHVNAALSAVWGAHAWSRFRALAQLPLDRALTRTLSITVDTDQLTCSASEVFLSRFVTEKWLVTIAGESNLFFQLDRLENERTARLAGGAKWIQTTAAAVAGVFKRTVYPLPVGCLTIRRVELSASGLQLQLVRPEELDRLKMESPTETGSPQYYCARQGELELWPALGTSTTREAVVLSYDREPAPPLTTTTPDSTEIDWDPRWDDLLRLAIDLELATKHPAQVRLDAGLARARFKERLHVCKGDDEGVVPGPTRMTLGGGFVVDEGYIFRRSPQGPDA